MVSVWSDHDEYSRSERPKEAKHLYFQRERADSVPSSPVDPYDDRKEKPFLQPETRPITQDQLVNEVKGSFCPPLLRLALTSLQASTLAW
jgi:hypothetical protein